MEALTANGVEAALFLETPDERALARFAGYRALGLAGVSRSQSPAWMDEHLPPAFEWLRATGAPLCHYKVCSTFDSAPHAGSIGRAIDIGLRVFDAPFAPVVAGAPSLGRYTLFANLFAAAGPQVHRIDRHPTMSRHPVTPMDEADLRLHLGRQTAKSIASFDILSLQAPDVDAHYHRLLETNPGVVLFDVLDEQSLTQIGRLLWQEATARQTFVAGSSGVEYALVAHWREAGLLPPPKTFASAEVDRIVVLSGSCSPVTESQIRWAESNGYAALRLDVAALAENPESARASIDQAVLALAQGRSAVLYTALGPDDRSPAALDLDAVGRHAGHALRDVIARSGVRRAVVAGGDTSGHAGQQLGLYALTMQAPIAPGAPLCRAWSDDPTRDGLEVVFKGGQCGKQDFFESVRQGRAQ
ncbi:MAG: four-carbon acid sugar kinase family protein [Acidobacteria bacterium]|nr:four-carbon acid sugar kinase family protein [Acidobacteriota bacterium]